MRCVLAIGYFSVAIVAASTGAEPVTVASTARSMQPGELVVLTVTTLEPAEVVRVRAFDRDVPVFRAGSLKWQALVGLAPTPLWSTRISGLVSWRPLIPSEFSRSDFPLGS
jgi:hypothetical protein